MMNRMRRPAARAKGAATRPETSFDKGRRLAVGRRRLKGAGRGKATLMNWEDPSFSEVRMDAEIGLYQDDFYPVRDSMFGSSVSSASEAEAAGITGE